MTGKEIIPVHLSEVDLEMLAVTEELNDAGYVPMLKQLIELAFQ